MNQKNTSKLIILISSLLIVLCLSIGGTFAYIIATDTPVSTTFKPASFDAYATENNGTYTVTTSGNVNTFVRVTVTAHWLKDGMTFTEPAMTSADYALVFDSTKWTQVGGYFYYNSPLVPGETTTGITVFLTGAAPEGCTFASDMIVETLPSNPAHVVFNTWGYLPRGY